MSRKPKDELTAHDLVVLSVLVEKPIHGYGLGQTLRERDVEDWAAMSKPQIYYSLKKLQAKKFIRAVNNQKEALGPESEIFSPTQSGLNALQKGLKNSEWATQRPPPPFLTWLALCSHLDKSERREMMKARKGFLESEVARKKKTFDDFALAKDAMADAGKLMVELTIKQFELELSWLNKVMQKLG